MNILFLSLSRIADINERGLYTDLMREFIRRGNKVYIASPSERRFGKPTSLKKDGDVEILKIKTLNIQKTNIIEKGIGTILLERQFDRAITKYWGDINFDLVLYATPPITFNRVIERVKSRSGAQSYLMLKDIFPQNAVDLGMLKKRGLLHRLFRKKEIRLYEISDTIGCMSPANARYLLRENPEIDLARVEQCPNSIELSNNPKPDNKTRNELLESLNIPASKTLSVYGGNLGKPQGIDFLIQVIESNENRKNSFIAIIGNGTEYNRLNQWFSTRQPANAALIPSLPKEAYDKVVACADIGLIFLDHRFTIPNYPSRLLSYMENAIPVMIASDPNTDIGTIAEENHYGFWCESNSLDNFDDKFNKLLDSKELRETLGKNGLEYLTSHYTVDVTVDTILERLK